MSGLEKAVRAAIERLKLAPRATGEPCVKCEEPLITGHDAGTCLECFDLHVYPIVLEELSRKDDPAKLVTVSTTRPFSELRPKIKELRDRLALTGVKGDAELLDEIDEWIWIARRASRKLGTAYKRREVPRQFEYDALIALFLEEGES